MTTKLQALLWDVDGTLAETERDGHRVAFNTAFEALRLPWHWNVARYGRLLRVTGGRERLLAAMAEETDAPVIAAEREALARELHRRKNAAYAELVNEGAIALRPGVRELLDEATQQGLAQAIVTTTSRMNVDALLGRHLGPRWHHRFAAVVCGEDVAAKKPSPEAHRKALTLLHRAPVAALAIEDSCAGATAARAAYVPVMVTRSAYFGSDPIDHAVAIGPGLHHRAAWRPACHPHDPAEGRVTLADLIDWHARMDLVSDRA
jgi:HAD superfamily hydrolase (TIGR01509 family)